MKINDIRESFLGYFESNDHERVRSSSLVPLNDPTLMFSNSGMVQFKNVFTGLESRDYSRAVTAQKCIRAGGKHNDLENVGYTLRHHTFFEMLGNFSFGDYFKDEAIYYAWNFITKELSISPDKLYVTIYHDDEQAYEAWKKISSFNDNKIIRISTKDNFWSMGDTGPCGPCSEIFYDHGNSFKGKPPSELDETEDRFVEIWNLVFMQYEQINENERIDLPKPSIDTGMGIERIAAVLQGTNDNYEVDSIKRIIENSIELTRNNENKFLSSHRVIADHLRSSCFLIADGVLPSNEGRGYVLRRIMRRAMRHVHLLQYNDVLMTKLVPTLINEMKDSYPELVRADSLITETLKYEEIKFKKLLDRGIKHLEEESSNLNEGDTLSGISAFKLYDTYGFPLDLTEDILRSKNINVNKSQFESQLDEQRKLARSNWSGSGDQETEKIWFSLNQKIKPTEFLGYTNNDSESTVLSIVTDGKETNNLKKGDQSILILNQTVFYAESGGQIGDEGLILNNEFKFIVSDTKRKGGIIIHIGSVSEGKISVGENVTCKINEEKRNNCRSYHSATHILHQALRDALGTHVAQKGSLVSNDKLRFDFSHHKAMTDKEVNEVEEKANLIINNETDVVTRLMTPEDAINDGALALFGEKYSDEVRVISIGELHGKTYSMELCGGTHVQNTREIGKVKIVSESSASSGVRRIEALRGEDLVNYEKSKSEEVIAQQKKSLEMENEKKDLLNNIEAFKKHIEIKIQSDTKNQVIIEKCSDLKPGELRPLIDSIKKQFYSEGIIVLLVINDDRLSFLVGVTETLSKKISAVEIAQYASSISDGNGGGGRADFAQSGGQLINEKEQLDQISLFIEDKLK